MKRIGNKLNHQKLSKREKQNFKAIGLLLCLLDLMRSYQGVSWLSGYMNCKGSKWQFLSSNRRLQSNNAGFSISLLQGNQNEDQTKNVEVKIITLSPYYNHTREEIKKRRITGQRRRSPKDMLSKEAVSKLF